MSQLGFAEGFLGSGVGRNARLEKIDDLIYWGCIEGLLNDALTSETGRPPYRPLSMFKALLLQVEQLFNGIRFPTRALKRRCLIGCHSAGFARCRSMLIRRIKRRSAASATGLEMKDWEISCLRRSAISLRHEGLSSKRGR